MKEYIKLIRPKHYLKNLLIFFPLIFSGMIFDKDRLCSTILGFIIFCIVSSIIYIINDIRDREKDKLHEKKKNRPIASGAISVKNAIAFLSLLILLSLILCYFLVIKISNYSYLYILIYFVVNFGYSFGLKNVPLVDIAILVSGFLLRLLFGASVIDVEISNWLYLTVMSLSFYLGLGKRRNEIIKSGVNSREVLKYYNQEFLDKNMYVFLSITIVFYSLWCVDSTTISKIGEYIIWTVPLIILICMRYSMIIEMDNHGDPVDVLTNDKILLFLVIIYIVIVFVMMLASGFIKWY